MNDTHKTLFLPGPTEVRKEIIDEMQEWMFGHRSDRMTDLYTTIVEETKTFLDTDHHVTVLTASGTEFMESSILNTVDDRVLCSTCGSFSERQADVAERLGKDVDRLEYDWGQAVKPDDVREALKQDDYDAFTCVMNETSTGVRNPLDEIGEVLADFPDTLFLVDAISALGGDYVDIEGSNIDVIFTSVQKAFAMPPGLAVCAFNDRAYEREVNADSASWYGGFQRIQDYYDRKGQTHSTPAIPIMRAYRKQIRHMNEEGHKSRSQRHRDMAEFTRDWAYEHFDMFPEEGYMSQTVSTIRNTRDLHIAQLRERVNEEYDMIFANGYGSKLEEKTFRIGHMGDHTVDDVRELTDAIEDVAGL